jgi:hypothetical protein
MPSVKLKSDTLAVLSGLRARFGSGHSYDKLICELVRREIEGTANAVMAGDRLRRIEEMLIQLTLKNQDECTTPAPQKFIIQ